MFIKENVNNCLLFIVIYKKSLMNCNFAVLPCPACGVYIATRRKLSFSYTREFFLNLEKKPSQNFDKSNVRNGKSIGFYITYI